ncbi:MAG: Ku protein [Nitrospirota bacterium]|jgi:DNA end-binding protein Ku
MKSTWKGYIRFSLVTIPVKMYTAISRKTISFNLLHGECGTRVRQHTYCPHCEKELDREEIVKGYRYGRDTYVPIEDEEIERAKKEATDAIEVMKFVDEGKIHPLYYSEASYLVPDGKVGAEAFALFLRAVEKTGKAALAKVVIRNREHIMAIKPHDGALVAYTLHYPEEIQKVSELGETALAAEAPVDEEQLALAVQIMENMSGPFRPEELVDEYSETLMSIIEAKAKGKKLEVRRPEERRKVVSLMDALRKSVQESRQMPGKKEMAAGRKRKPGERKRKTA